MPRAPLLRPLPADGFDTGTALWPKADRFARVSVGKRRTQCRPG